MDITGLESLDEAKRRFLEFAKSVGVSKDALITFKTVKGAIKDIIATWKEQIAAGVQANHRFAASIGEIQTKIIDNRNALKRSKTGMTRTEGVVTRKTGSNKEETYGPATNEEVIRFQNAEQALIAFMTKAKTLAPQFHALWAEAAEGSAVALKSKLGRAIKDVQVAQERLGGTVRKQRAQTDAEFNRTEAKANASRLAAEQKTADENFKNLKVALKKEEGERGAFRERLRKSVEESRARVLKLHAKDLANQRKNLNDGTVALKEALAHREKLRKVNHDKMVAGDKKAQGKSTSLLKAKFKKEEDMLAQAYQMNRKWEKKRADMHLRALRMNATRDKSVATSGKETVKDLTVAWKSFYRLIWVQLIHKAVYGLITALKEGVDYAVKLQKSLAEVAMELGYNNHVTILKIMKRHKLKRRSLSEACSGKKNGFFGKEHSKKTKEKISKAKRKGD